MSNVTLHEAIRIAADGDAILFVGAGVGFLVKGPKGPLPDGTKLSNRILGRLDDEPDAPPLDRAAGFAIRKGVGADGLYDILKENLSIVEVDDLLARLYSLPWKRIYTTNYDDAIEIARDRKQPTNSCQLESSVSSGKIGTVLHINGRFATVSPASIDSDLSLSDRSYATRNFEKSPWYGYFSRDLDNARAIIFVGYSLYDLDIARVIFSSNIKSKTFFFVHPNVDEIEEDTISQYGQIPGGGAIALLAAMDESLSDYSPSSRKMRFSHLREIGSSEVPTRVEPSRLLDAQLVFGTLPEREVVENDSVFDDKPFVINRAQTAEALDLMRRGLYRDVLITGEFVSGKSAAALTIVANFVQQGYRAYFAEHGARLSEELDELASLDDRVVVVFEGYSTFRRTIIDYAQKRNARHRLILTEQSVQHELYGDFLNSPALVGRVFEVVLDRISDPDASAFTSLLDFGGYWGERSGLSEHTNARYITHSLQGSLYRLLLEIVESKDVQNRIDRILEPILFNKRATEVFVAACSVNVLGAQFRIADWVGAFDPQFVKGVLRNYADEVKYFLLVQSGHVFPRNGVLSSFILKRVKDRSIILEALLKLFRIAAHEKQPFDVYDDVFVRLMQFNRLQPILSGPSEKDMVLSFYEKIRPISETYKNPDYWLQLGIAATAFDELDVAADAFENAYFREDKQKRPNFKRIDNYYNRYLLKFSSSAADSQDAFDLFSEAVSGLAKQMYLEDNRHYPFKSGRAYRAFAQKHFANWRSDQQQTFIAETRNIRDKAIQYENKHKGKSKDVDVLIRETGELLAKLGALK
ncbi:SIR2 family protein [Sphingomonas sp.]|uniref:SIR2 family protein n=1 Tax=Sphingomonas sp. TaxID=28214 RepID=UPI0035C7FDF7